MPLFIQFCLLKWKKKMKTKYEHGLFFGMLRGNCFHSLRHVNDLQQHVDVFFFFTLVQFEILKEKKVIFLTVSTLSCIHTHHSQTSMHHFICKYSSDAPSGNQENNVFSYNMRKASIWKKIARTTFEAWYNGMQDVML